jgi:hypothetical protein
MVRTTHLRLVGGRDWTKCEICGGKAGSGTLRCDNCWEVEQRLEEYLKHPAGRANVADVLMRLYADGM